MSAFNLNRCAVLTILALLAALLAACDGAALPTSAPVTPPPPAAETPTVVLNPTATPTPFIATSTPPPVGRTPLEQGFGAEKGFWRVLFTDPTGSRDASKYVGGIDYQLAEAIAGVQRTLDIAAFEFNSPILTQAVLDAHARGVAVRMVADNEHGVKDRASTIPQLQAAGIPVVDDARPSLMHNKFMILDGTTVWFGSWNFTVNDTYRNNNNALALTSRRAVQNFQNQFNQMFEQRLFSVSKRADTPFPSFSQDSIPIQVLFAPKERIVAAVAVALSSAQQSIRFMTFSFTLDDIAGVMQQKAMQGVVIQGIFERTGSETRTSELTPLFCSGLDVRQDGNPFVLHHKVFIVDNRTVITGSFNFSQGARDENDENLVIISDPDLALQYVEEFNRRWAQARVPTALTCP